MKIELNKDYITRQGEIVTTTRQISIFGYKLFLYMTQIKDDFPQTGYWVNSKGKIFGSLGIKVPEDIVSEI